MIKLKGVIKSEKLHNDKGFTLIEIIVAISIVAVVAGLSGFGLNVLFQANVDSMGNEIFHDLRDIRYRTVSEFDTDYQMVFTYDTTTKRYGYIINKRYEDTSVTPSVFTGTVIKQRDYRPTLVIERWDESSGAWIDINDASLNIGTNPENVTFPFLTSGAVGSASITTGGVINSLVGNATSTVGKYRIVSSRTTDKIELVIIEKTGRVVKYE